MGDDGRLDGLEKQQKSDSENPASSKQTYWGLVSPKTEKPRQAWIIRALGRETQAERGKCVSKNGKRLPEKKSRKKQGKSVPGDIFSMYF